MNFKLSGNLMI